MNYRVWVFLFIGKMLQQRDVAMGSSCLNKISEDRVNKVCSRIIRTERKPFLICLYLYHDPSTAEELLIKAKKMQYKTLHPFPVICSLQSVEELQGTTRT